ncbi:MAG: beta-galactosidase trimerization domain-containing protein, partial [Kiritimatiellae bacterium]|nr:beta-galactosidase trimerization domain-containing protein [Kiritimatiellia bacterium]
AAGNAEVRWTMEDFSGRVLESGTVRAGAKIKIPTKSLFTNKGVVRAYLHVDGKVVAVDRADMYAREKDWQRFENDFGVGIWGQGMAVSRDSYPTVDAQLQKAGVFCQSLPINYYSTDRNLAFSMSSGMAVGGGYLSKHEVFYPKQIGESNNRSTYGAINTKKAREMISQLAQDTSKRYAKYGPIAYTVCDEPNLSLRFTKDEPDEEPENILEYRRRMEVKYATIDEYNRRHRTSHASFADIGPVRIEDARRTGNFAEYVEWRNFNTDRWVEAIKVVADGGKKTDPTLRLSLFNSFGQTAVSGNDYWKLLTKSGLGFSNEYTSMVYMRRDAIYNFDEFYRSFRPDLRVWGFTGYNMNAAQVKFTPWWFAAHRYGGFTWFAVMDWDWRFIDQPTLALTRDAADIKAALDASRVQDGLGKLFLEYQWKPRDIAVYYSHDSLLTATLLGKERISYDIGSTGPLHDYMYSRQGIQYILEDMLCQFDFVAPEQISSGALDKYKIVFMPRIIALSDMEVEKLKSFVKNGGKVVADQLPGDYDELGVKRRANPLSDLGIVVTGANFDDLSIPQRKEVLDLVNRSGASPVLASRGIENVFGREAMHFTDGVNSIFPVLRMPLRSSDNETQQFVFPKKGYIYDVKNGEYLGFGDRVTAAVPHADASVWAILPEKVGSLSIDAPAEVRCGTDLVANIALEKARGRGVFHVEVVSPTGECGFHMKRNIETENGKAKFVFRMAGNDICGKWTIRVTDVATRVKSSHDFILSGK